MRAAAVIRSLKSSYSLLSEEVEGSLQYLLLPFLWLCSSVQRSLMLYLKSDGDNLFSLLYTHSILPFTHTVTGMKWSLLYTYNVTYRVQDAFKCIMTADVVSWYGGPSQVPCWIPGGNQTWDLHSKGVWSYHYTIQLPWSTFCERRWSDILIDIGLYFLFVLLILTLSDRKGTKFVHWQCSLELFPNPCSDFHDRILHIFIAALPESPKITGL